MRIHLGLAVGTLVIATTVCLASGGRWLHVRVEEGGGSGQNVRVNVPLSAVEAMLPVIAGEALQQGRLLIDGSELEGLDLHEMLRALAEAPDANFIAVQDHGESVRVAKDDGFLIVHIEDGSTNAGEKVRVRLPLDVVEAMVAGKPGEIDLLAGIRALSEHADGDLVRVESVDETVRIWIDSNEAGE